MLNFAKIIINETNKLDTKNTCIINGSYSI